MFKIGKYIKEYKAPIIIGPCAKLFETLTDIISPYLMAKIIDVGISTGNLPYIYKLSLFILLINLAGFGFAVICQRCSAVVEANISRSIRRDMFAHINTLSHAELDKFSTVTLTNRLIYDVTQTSTAVGMTIRNVFRAPILLIGSLIMAMCINLKLSLIFVVILPIILFVVIFIMKKNNPLYLELKSDLDGVTDVARDNLDSVRVVRAFNKQDYETQRFKNKNDKFTQTNIGIIKNASLLQPLIAMVVNFGIIAIIWIGGIQVNIGGMTTGDLLAFVNYLTSISGAMVKIARIIIVYTRTGSSVTRIREVMDTENTILEPRRPVKIDYEDITGKVEFKNVGFSYAKTKDVVNGLSFVAEQGNVIGVIGGTGSGKSSVVNLIPRFYDVSSGEVLISDHNVKRYNLDTLRKLIGVVPQSAVLFEGTIRSNMKWRDPDATDEDIIKALRIAQAYEFVKELPDFLDHKVYRGGTNFSGGQRQRLTVARALVGKPKILILDDSSSALDFATDASMRLAIRKNLQDVTTFIVSQRATTLMHADKIIVLDNGNVVGIGTHDELLKDCLVYKEIYYSQNPKEEDDDE